jgi:hypothetical protein
MNILALGFEPGKILIATRTGKEVLLHKELHTVNEKTVCGYVCGRRGDTSPPIIILPDLYGVAQRVYNILRNNGAYKFQVEMHDETEPAAPPFKDYGSKILVELAGMLLHDEIDLPADDEELHRQLKRCTPKKVEGLTAVDLSAPLHRALVVAAACQKIDRWPEPEARKRNDGRGHDPYAERR